MNKIKSKYILIQCFSFLPTNTLLKLILLNKNLQSKVDITIENYKIASNYYITKDNKICRYSTNELIFEGKYEKGEKIEGKEYKNGKLYFIGKYKNNLKYKGTLLNIKGNPIFEGEFNKGHFWSGKFHHPDSYKYNIIITSEIKNGYGFVIEYDYNCFLAFKGQYKEGKKFSGIEYNNFGNKIFEGEYKYNNLRWNGSFFSPDEKKVKKIKEGNGKDIEIYDAYGTLIFKGELKKGKRFKGEGKEYYKQNGQLKFEGKYQNFLYYKGKLYNINGHIEYNGLFHYGNKNEILLFQQKDKFNYSFFYGQLNEGKKYYGIEINGTGAFVGKFETNGNYSEGKYYKGDFDIEEKKQIYEEGNLTSINIKEIEKNGKLIFEGKFKNGLFYKDYNEYNIYYHFHKESLSNNIIYKIDYYESGYMKYEGEYKNGLYYKGKEYFDPIDEEPDENKLKFEGIYKEGKKYIGWEYNYQGGLIFVGEYNSGLFWNGCFYFPGELLSQEKSGYINKGSGSDLKIYDDFGKLKFEGELKQGKYYNGKGITIENEYGVIKDISPDQDDKKIRIEICRDGTFKEGKLIQGCEINKYIINEEYLYEKNFNGKIKNGTYYNGKEIIYKKRKVGNSGIVRLERDYLYGKIMNIKYA